MQRENASMAIALSRARRKIGKEGIPELIGDWTRRFVRRHGVLLVLLAAATLWTWFVWAVAGYNARHDLRAELESAYQAKLAAFYAEREAEEAAEIDPYLAQLDAEATAAARLLSGVEGYHYDSDSKRTLLRCVFNRVANAAYPSTLEEVVRESGQWIQYHESNPVYEADYQLAREEIDAWHNETRLPCSTDFVFADFTATEIVLRDSYYKTAGTRYWRWGQ